ncbi:class I SAM-dependent methyltransferase [Alphaproteobacteria bacterium]|nr:class I SAM-dependent methyltransferase [Alphaproteobacteria bacterium]
MFNKNNPSEKFLTLKEYYKSLHAGNLTDENKNDIYNGKTTMVFAKIIKAIIEKNNIKNLLDYGSGKGDRYFNNSEFGNEAYPPLEKYWNINSTLYDPGVPHPKPVGEKFDMVISIDVLEHIPLEDLGWVIEEIFYFSKKIIFINVACYAAERTFSDGSNVHVSLFPPMWWYGFISKIALNLDKKCFLVCSSFKDDTFQFSNFAINDNFENYSV